MFETLFGAEVPPAVKFFLAFVIVLALIGLTAWLVRRFGSERFGGSSARGRQPRLAVVDAASVDGRRKLVIIRRDNVEHLLMIGGPTDVVVEQNIVRAMGAPRDKTVEPSVGRGFGLSDSLTRPVPLGEGTAWPLQPQPQPEIPVRPQPHPESNGRAAPPLAQEPMQWTWPAPAEPQRPAPEPQRPARNDSALNNLAEELSSAPPPAKEPKLERVTPPKPRTALAASTAMTAPPVATAAPAVTPPAPAPAAPAPTVTPEPRAAAGEPDEQLAEMAHRLEAALRRPSEPAAAAPAVEPPVKSEPAAPPPRITPPEQKPARAESKPSPPKALYDSLEEEMASLLGRPPGKTG